MLRRTGLRYGIALTVILLVIVVVIAVRTTTHESVRPAGVAAADDGAAVPPPPATPSTRPGAQDPTSTARAFARTWIGGAAMTAPEWRRAMAKYSTGTLTRQFDGVDPSSVPAHTLTGVPKITSTARSYVVISVPTDTGTLILGLRATDGEWLVDSVDWTAA
jgi:hypothetical protein